MTCENRLVFGPTPGWTNGNTGTSGANIIMTPWMNTRDIVKVRAAIKFTESTGNFSFRWRAQLSNDQTEIHSTTSGSPSMSFASTEDQWEVADWATANADNYPWIRFMIQCSNVSSGDIERANLHMVLDFNRSA